MVKPTLGLISLGLMTLIGLTGIGTGVTGAGFICLLDFGTSLISGNFPSSCCCTSAGFTCEGTVSVTGGIARPETATGLTIASVNMNAN